MKKVSLLLSMTLCVFAFTGCTGETFNTKFINMANIGETKYFVIISREKLYEIANTQPYAKNENVEFQNQNEKYTNDYFEKNNLILIFFSNEDFSKTIKKMSINDNTLTIQFKEKYDGVSNDSITWHACYIEVNNKIITKVEIKTK